jgi:hypothetical protein
MNLYPCFPYFLSLVKFDVDLHIKLLNICEFREKLCSESCTVLSGVNESVPVSSTLSAGLDNIP